MTPFTKPPVNAEVFLKRLSDFKSQLPSLSQSKAHSYILDCIAANRQLQSRSPYHSPDDFLNITKSPDKSHLESMLWNALHLRPTFMNDPSVVKAFLVTKPYPEPSTITDVIRRRWLSQTRLWWLPWLRKSSANIDLVRLGINVLLSQHQYVECINLIDKTVGSTDYRAAMDKTVKRNTLALGFGLVSATAVQSMLLSVSPLVLLLANTTVWGAVTIGLLHVKYPGRLDRLCWRLSNSFLYNIKNYPTLKLIHRIMIYFEEHHEINLMNYHLSQIRTFDNINIKKYQDYFIESDEINFQQFFKDQLTQKKITAHDLPEELQFLDFIMNHGENYQWVEPDQDPAEIIRLKLGTGEEGKEKEE